MEFQGLLRVQDVEKESQYGYVYGVSGPGKWSEASNMLKPKLVIQELAYLCVIHRAIGLFLAMHVRDSKIFMVRVIKKYTCCTFGALSVRTYVRV